MKTPRTAAWLLPLALSFFSQVPDAAACGGTFCDSGPQAMPVDQTGENILFVVDGGTVEAHVQIQYSGDPTRFAWVVPMPAVPTVSVGSEQLFTNLLSGTVPSFGFTTQFDSCPCFSCGAGGSSASGGAAGFPMQDAGAAMDGGVNVLFSKTVGAFEVTALSGHSSQEVVDWLAANGYQSVATAPALLDDYVQKGSVFVAVKLTAGAGTNQIHPLVFKYVGTEPCIPLKLTAVAAKPDMGVRAFFLGDDRVVSTNYAHATLNPARLDWLNNVSNYTAAVSRAVDEADPGGHAFVTEYAGSSGIVPAFNLSNAAWSEAEFAGIDPRVLTAELTRQGLLACWGGPGSPGSCSPYHPLVIPLLEEFLPPPAGVDPAAFYSCVSCFEAQTDLTKFDGAAFAQAIGDRIFDPGRHAMSLLERYPYLTRLFTTISPEEMTLDPFFEGRPGLSGVSAGSTFASRRIAQDGRSGFTLPDGRQVGLDASGLWPAFSSLMSWTETVTSYPAGKPEQLLATHTADIDAQLDAWNATMGWPAPPPECPGVNGSGGSPPGGGGTGGWPFNTGTGGASTGGATGKGSGGTPGEGPLTPAGAASGDDGGCAVTGTPAGGTAHWLALAGTALALGRLRRTGRTRRDAR